MYGFSDSFTTIDFDDSLANSSLNSKQNLPDKKPLTQEAQRDEKIIVMIMENYDAHSGYHFILFNDNNSLPN